MARSTNAFDVSGPSILAGDRTFTPDRGGLSRSQRCMLTVEKRKAETGWCPGLISGLSPKADKQVHLPKKRKG